MEYHGQIKRIIIVPSLAQEHPESKALRHGTKINSGLTGRAGHRNMRYAVLQIGLTHRLKTKIGIKTLEVLLGRQPNGLSWSLSVQGVQTAGHQFLSQARPAYFLGRNHSTDTDFSWI